MSYLSKRRAILEDAARAAFQLRLTAEERARRILSTVDHESEKGHERARVALDDVALYASRSRRAERLIDKVLTDKRGGR